MLVAKQVPETFEFPADVWKGAVLSVRMCSKSVMEAARVKAQEDAQEAYRKATAGMSAEETAAFVEAARGSNKDSGEGSDLDATSEDPSSGSTIDPIEGPTLEQWQPFMVGADVELVIAGSFVKVSVDGEDVPELCADSLAESLTEVAYNFIAMCATWVNRPRPLVIKS